jgi:fucose 4-O-acetylase-like acetyltransferase
MTRDTSIDLAKALAIASVVLGHILEARVLADGGMVETVLYRWIYAFHMPFWFLLSGYLYRSAQEPGRFFGKKFVHLMVPYLAWLVVFNGKAIAGLGVNLVRGMTDEKWQFYRDHFYNQAYGGELVGGAQMVLWFPVCLFFTQQVANLLFRFVPQPSLRWAIGLIFFVFGYANQFLVPDFRLPLALNVVAGALPFFLIGHALRGPWPRWRVPLALLPVVLVMLGIAIPQWPLHFHMRMAEYGWPLLSTLGALGTFLGLLQLCRSLARIPWLVRIANPVGEASMTIMYLHVVVLVQLANIGATSWIFLLIGGVFLPTALHLVLERISLLRLCFLGATADKVRSPCAVEVQTAR